MNRYYEDMMDNILEEHGVFDEAKRIKGKDGSKDKSKLDDLLSLNNDKRYELSDIDIILSILAFINLSLISL